MRVALVHDFLKEWGGAEEVFAVLLEQFPQAEVYASVSFPSSRLHRLLKNRTVHTSFLQRLPFSRQLFPYLIPLMPFAFEQFDFSQYDLVISDTASFAKGIIVPPGVRHISYVHTPPRFLWGLPSSRQDKVRNPLWKLLLPFVNRYLRHWDYLAAQRPDVLIANSAETAGRIKRFYTITPSIIYPPVPVEQIRKRIQSPPPQPFADLQLIHKKYFVALTRLERYKRVDQLIEAFRAPALREYTLVIAGKGDDEEHLRTMAQHSPHVRFVGFADEEWKFHLLAGALALLNPQREDFGITMVESLAAGTPVIAAKEGGAVEIVTQSTGVLYEPSTTEALVHAITAFLAKPDRHSRANTQKRAAHFSTESFKESLNKLLSAKAEE